MRFFITHKLTNLRWFKRWGMCPKQLEINRLRGVLHDIASNPPHRHMDIHKTPELTRWIVETCNKANRGAYPPDKKSNKN